MARLFPVRSQFQLETFGERQFAERLEDDYLCWSNVPIGPSAGYQDFVMLQPRRGVLKGWTLSAIQSRVSTALKTENRSVPFFRSLSLGDTAGLCVSKGNKAIPFFELISGENK